MDSRASLKGLHPATENTLVETVLQRFSEEIGFYTHPKMATTPQDAGLEHREQWTGRMLNDGLIKVLPGITDEMRHLLDEADINGLYKALFLNVSTADEAFIYFDKIQKQLATAKQLSQEDFNKVYALKNTIIHARFAELERTLTALYNILLLEIDAEEAYVYFKIAQYDWPIAKQISLENFRKIHALRNNIINESADHEKNSEDLILLIYFIIYSDFGKSPRLRELLTEKGYDQVVDPSLAADDLIIALMRELGEAEIVSILPSFGKLSDFNKKRLIDFYPLMGPCFGHIMFYERGKRIFELIAEVLLSLRLTDREHAVKLLFLAQFGDGMGAQGQARIEGSATCNNEFYETYQLMHDSLVALERDLRPYHEAGVEKQKSAAAAAETAFNINLATRAEWLGFHDVNPEAKPILSHKDQVLMRAGAMMRCPKNDASAIVLNEYWKDNLTDAQRDLLIEQLSFSPETLAVWSDRPEGTPKGLEDLTRVDYAATAVLNLAQDHMKVGRLAQGIAAGMRGFICLAMLLRYMGEKYPTLIKDPKRTISLGEFASFTRNNPDFYNPEIFDVTKFELNFKTFKMDYKKPSAHVSQSFLSPRLPAPSQAAVSSSSTFSNVRPSH
jgi:hypothetical protein